MTERSSCTQAALRRPALNDFTAGVRGDVATPTRRREIAERNSLYWGIKWIIVPNPMYGSWESAFHGPKRLEREDRLRRKIEHLDRF